MSKAIPEHWIKEVRLKNFRGISQGSMTFTDSGGNAVSTLILGDNGSGKSSFLDAIMFATTGREPELTNAGNSIRVVTRYLMSADGEPTEVGIHFADGTVRDTDLESRAPLEDFRVVKPLIKRDHLLAFSHGTDQQRGGMLRTLVNTYHLPKDKAGDNEDQIRVAKAASRATFDATLASLLPLMDLTDSYAPDLNVRDVQIFRTANKITRKQAKRSSKTAKQTRSRLVITLGEQLQQAAVDHERANNELAGAKKSRQRDRIVQLLVDASDELDRAFQEIAAPATLRLVQSISIRQGRSSGEVALVVILPGGEAVDAGSVLSEAALDLTALLALLALVRTGADRGQTKVLLLDDVFQSVDATLRDGVARYLFEEFSDWQLIATFHDRMWLQRFSSIASELNVTHTKRRVWRTPDGSSRVSGSFASSKEHLDSQLAQGNFDLVPSAASKVLEELAEALSQSLQSEVRRRDDDGYTLGDLWDGLERRAQAFPRASAALARVGETKYLRNLVGAHSTSWAGGYTDSEAEEYGLAVIALYELTICADCGTPVRRGKGLTACRCKALHLL